MMLVSAIKRVHSNRQNLAASSKKEVEVNDSQTLDYTVNLVTLYYLVILVIR